MLRSRSINSRLITRHGYERHSSLSFPSKSYSSSVPRIKERLWLLRQQLERQHKASYEFQCICFHNVEFIFGRDWPGIVSWPGDRCEGFEILIKFDKV